MAALQASTTLEVVQRAATGTCAKESQFSRRCSYMEQLDGMRGKICPP